MNSLLGIKKEQSQRFLQNGMRIPVTLIDVKENSVIAIKTSDRDHYQAIQLGYGAKKRANRSELGHAKGAKKEGAPKFLREVRIFDESETLPEVGSILNPKEVFTPGDIVDVAGVSKGKGYAGVVKRWGFHGGPKTHGQSDRHRAPGAIGQGTTPGRVYRGKKMAGRMGNARVTIENLEIMEITNDGVLIVKGLVPGIINGLMIVKKVGEDKKFVPLYSDKNEEDEKPAITESTEESTETQSLSSENSDSSENQNVSESENQNKSVETAPAEDLSSEESEPEASSQEPEAKSKEIAKDAK